VKKEILASLMSSCPY